MPSQEAIWPGEREPSHLDVEVANELPEPAFLSDFKRELLSSPKAKEKPKLMHLDLKSLVTDQKKFTYPMAVLSNIPSVPPPNEITYLRQVFSISCASHIFFGRLPLPEPSREPIAPPLRLAIACLASVYLNQAEEESTKLFLAGMSLWTVIMEVDNREARSLELLMAAILLIMYGASTTDAKVSSRSALLLSSSMTIARRMRFHDPVQLEGLLGSSASSYRFKPPPQCQTGLFVLTFLISGAFIWALWLADILHALRSDLSLNFFSSRELWTKMPCSPYEFQDIYRTLLDQNDNTRVLPADLTAPEDGFLLLMAMLSDLQILRRSLHQLLELGGNQRTKGHAHNPFVPLSPHTELDRMQSILRSALDRWHDKFRPHVPPEMMSFYHYCKLYATCDQLQMLPYLAGNQTVTSRAAITQTKVVISDQSIRHAWLVLDTAAARSKPPASDHLCPVWLPIIVFHASLVVWAKQRLDSTEHSSGYGSRRMLVAFKIEIEGMPWPCCQEMAATLERLMADPGAR